MTLKTTTTTTHEITCPPTASDVATSVSFLAATDPHATLVGFEIVDGFAWNSLPRAVLTFQTTHQKAGT